MPIRRELRALYPRRWRELSFTIRFVRGRARCEQCARPHLRTIRVLQDGRWFDEELGTWRGARGRPARWPDLVETTTERRTRVILAAAHLDGNPRNNRMRNLRGLCQRCHLLHDLRQHRWARWVTYRLRYACGDLFLGAYAEMLATRAPVALAPVHRVEEPLLPWRFRPDPRLELPFPL